MEARFGDNNNLPESCTPLVWLGATSAESGSIIVWVILRHYLHFLHEVGLASAHFLLNLELDNLTGQQIPVGYKASALSDSG
jgi:hypothetical protein